LQIITCAFFIFQMKPVQILCLALFCLSMVFAAPAPEPIFPVVGTTLVLPTLVGASGAALTATELAALAGAGLLTKAGLLALLAQ
jgi:hypothetical protein